MPAASRATRGRARTLAIVAPIISHPFRIGLTGHIATVEQSSDAAGAEQIALLCLTRPGERPLVPGYGLSDPTFEGFQGSELAAAVALWGPDVSIDAVDVRQLSDSVERVQVRYR